ncbi:hypothetical protein DIPPA_11484 [Diplonema papillatum]|nr:hypothetical protein DIPPA_11484 [Diplonema papillatum]
MPKPLDGLPKKDGDLQPPQRLGKESSGITTPTIECAGEPQQQQAGASKKTPSTSPQPPSGQSSEQPIVKRSSALQRAHDNKSPVVYTGQAPHHRSPRTTAKTLSAPPHLQPTTPSTTPSLQQPPSSPTSGFTASQPSLSHQVTSKDFIKGLQNELADAKSRCIAQVQESLELVNTLQEKQQSEKHLQNAVQELQEELGKSDAALEVTRKEADRLRLVATSIEDGYVQTVQQLTAEKARLVAEAQHTKAEAEQRVQERDAKIRLLEAALREGDEQRQANSDIENEYRRQIDVLGQHIRSLETELAARKSNAGSPLPCRSESDPEESGGASRSARGECRRLEARNEELEQLHAETVELAQAKLKEAERTNDRLREAAEARDAKRVADIERLQAELRERDTQQRRDESPEHGSQQQRGGDGTTGALVQKVEELTRINRELERTIRSQDAQLLTALSRKNEGGPTHLGRLEAEVASLTELHDDALRQANDAEEARLALLEKQAKLMADNSRLQGLAAALQRKVQEAEAPGAQNDGEYADPRQLQAALGNALAELSLYRTQLSRTEAEIERERLLAAKLKEDKHRVDAASRACHAKYEKLAAEARVLREENSRLQALVEQFQDWAVGVVTEAQHGSYKSTGANILL